MAILATGRGLVAFELSLGIDPGEPHVPRRSGQPGVVENGAAILVGVDHGLDVNQRAPRKILNRISPLKAPAEMSPIETVTRAL